MDENIQGDIFKFVNTLLQGLNNELRREAQEPVCKRLEFSPQRENLLKQKVYKLYHIDSLTL